MCKDLKKIYNKTQNKTKGFVYLLEGDIQYLWIEGAAQKASVILGSSHSMGSR